MTQELMEVTAADRAVTVSWLMEVVSACGLQSATLFLAVSYLDRFLGTAQVRPPYLKRPDLLHMVRPSATYWVTTPVLYPPEPSYLDISDHLLLSHCPLKGVTTGMLQLSAVACLSIAAKQQEVNEPKQFPTDCL